MEKAKELLQLSMEESEMVSRVAVNPHEFQVGPSFFEDFALRGIQVHRVQPSMIFCTFKVPPRLLNERVKDDPGEPGPTAALVSTDDAPISGDRSGNMAAGAIANLIDIVGNGLIYRVGKPMNVSVHMSISYLSNAKLDDELEVTSELLGRIGSISGTSVTVKNKATGEIVAEGRHSLFSRLDSKM